MLKSIVRNSRHKIPTNKKEFVTSEIKRDAKNQHLQKYTGITKIVLVCFPCTENTVELVGKSKSLKNNRKYQKHSEFHENIHFCPHFLWNWKKLGKFVFIIFQFSNIWRKFSVSELFCWHCKA